jgi:hypothetical protein
VTDPPVAAASSAVTRAKALHAALQAKRRRLRELYTAMYEQRQEVVSLHAEVDAQMRYMRTLSGQLREALGERRSADFAASTRLGDSIKSDVGALASPDAMHLSRVARPSSLEELMRTLYVLGIHSGVHTCADGLHVWISDRQYLHREDCLFRRRNGDAITDGSAVVQWMHETAQRLLATRDRPDLTAADVGESEVAAG